MSSDFESPERAEFNMAVSYLNRLNILFSQCDQASISLDIYTWFHSLLATYRELSTWMPDLDERNKINESIKQINPMISKAYQAYSKTGKLEIPHELYMLLHDLELKMRDVASKSGLMMKMADDAMNALK
jgi:hypothetical protein